MLILERYISMCQEIIISANSPSKFIDKYFIYDTINLDLLFNYT